MLVTAAKVSGSASAASTPSSCFSDFSSWRCPGGLRAGRFRRLSCGTGSLGWSDSLGGSECAAYRRPFYTQMARGAELKGAPARRGRHTTPAAGRAGTGQTSALRSPPWPRHSATAARSPRRSPPSAPPVGPCNRQEKGRRGDTLACHVANAAPTRFALVGGSSPQRLHILNPHGACRRVRQGGGVHQLAPVRTPLLLSASRARFPDCDTSPTNTLHLSAPG